MKSRRKMFGGAIAAAIAALVAVQVVPIFARHDDDDQIVLAWQRMAAEPAAAVNVDTNTRGIIGGKLPWDIHSASGYLTLDGDLVVHIKGLILDNSVPNDGTPFSGGKNPFDHFGVLVSCLTVDPATNTLVVRNISPIDHRTGHPILFPATVPGGNCDIHTAVVLPDPCIAPIVFVTSPTFTWIAASGFGN